MAGTEVVPLHELDTAELLRVLRNIYSIVLTAALALRYQDADHDVEIAEVLTRAAADPLDSVIERLRPNRLGEEGYRHTGGGVS